MFSRWPFRNRCRCPVNIFMSRISTSSKTDKRFSSKWNPWSVCSVSSSMPQGPFFAGTFGDPPSSVRFLPSQYQGTRAVTHRIGSSDQRQGSKTAEQHQVMDTSHGTCFSKLPFRVQAGSYMSLRVALRSTPAEAKFLSCLVDDRHAIGQSYVEYLCSVHRNIQNRLS